ncbi:MAG: hypothetical protein IJ593_05005 [Lachnospiraceae bacterium]|nr:hypothetical protein [Lachnospiraceae bacterium]
MNIREKMELCRKLPIIKTGKIKRDNIDTDKTRGLITIRPINYPQYIEDWKKQFNESGLLDFDYIRNSDKIRDKDIDDLTLDETLTMLTSIIRGERFCDGYIASAIESGALEKLTTHLHELCE